MSIIEDSSSPTSDAETRIAQLEATVERLARQLESHDAAAREAEPVDVDVPHGSRRNLFKLAAGAAAGGTALALAKTGGPVAAADTDAITAGEQTNSGDSGTKTTVLAYQNTSPPAYSFLTFDYNANIFTVRDNSEGFVIVGADNSSGYPAAVGGYANSTVANGLYGYTKNSGFGVVGYGGGSGSAGILARGARANLEFYNDGDAPSARTDIHTRGEMVCDDNGNLWYCIESGTPGSWRKIAGADTAGGFHPATPFRVYDSREEGSGGIAGSSDVTLSVKDGRDPESYAVTIPDAVPEGATAISANIVAINAVGNGFATVNPGGDTSVGAAALNWKEGQTIGNAGIFKINDTRDLTVLVRGITNIDFTVDITGYWL
jgi:hypothetical protein